jgi:hypothetical protein
VGEAKRRKQLDLGCDKESGKPGSTIQLGKFLNSSEMQSISSRQIEEAGIKDSGKCIAFTIGFKLGGVAFPSVNEKGIICVGMISFPLDSRLSKAEGDKIVRSAEPEIMRLVAEAYKAKFYF